MPAPIVNLSMTSPHPSHESQVPELACDCLSQVRSTCHAGQQKELIEAGIVGSVLSAMQRHRTHQTVQALGAEVLGLLAGADGHEQLIFSLGAVWACLDACRSFPASEAVLGAAFQAVSNICFARHSGDTKGCARKTAAVQHGALELVVAAIDAHPEARWVQQAAVMAVGSLCNGLDGDAGKLRRARARTSGAIERAASAAARCVPQLLTRRTVTPSHDCMLMSPPFPLMTGTHQSSPRRPIETRTWPRARSCSACATRISTPHPQSSDTCGWGMPSVWL